MTNTCKTNEPNFVWQSASQTNRGNVRQYNEDAFIARNDICLWAVADGMGGHKAGDIASQLIIKMLAQLNARANLSSYVDAVDDMLIEANHQLRTLSKRKYNNHTIGSTVAALVAHERHIAYLWAGDSRVYRIRDTTITQLTRDHSEVQNMVDQGLIQAEDAETHPSANIITRALGAADTLHLSVGVEETQNNDIYIICSDGLYRDISDQELFDISLNSSPNQDVSEICDNMMKLALSREAKDNVTTIIVKSTLNL